MSVSTGNPIGLLLSLTYTFPEGNSTPAYLCGKDISQSSASAYTRGASDANASVASFISPDAVDKTSVSAYAMGHSGNTTSTSVCLVGKDTANTSVSLFLHGVESDRCSAKVYIHGKLSSITDVLAFLRGQTTENSSVPVFLAGKKEELSQASAFVHGSFYQAFSLSVFISGKTSDLFSVPAYLAGGVSSNTSAYLGGSSNALDATSVYLSGALLSTTSHAAYLLGIEAPVEGFDLPYFGSPFYQVPAKTSIILDTLDYVYFGEPFWAVNIPYKKDSVSAYLEGFSYDRETSLSAYLRGRDPCASTSAYIKGQVSSTSFKRAYTRGLGIQILGELSVFIEGSILSRDSAPAYIVGLVGEESESINVYLSGINRASVTSYLQGSEYASGTGAFIDYIILSTDTLSKRFKVLQQDYGDGTEERTEEITKTISGGIEHSVGAIYTTWNMIVRAKAQETDSRYGTRDNLEYFYAQHQVVFTDHRSYEHNVRIIGKLTKNLITTVVEGGSALYLYRLELTKDEYA